MLTINKTGLKTFQAAPKSFLGTMEIFKGLPLEALKSLEGRMVERKYAKSDPIFLEGDPAESVWFVKEGHVKAGVNAANGRCQTLCMVGPGKMFGSCCCFGGGVYPCQAVAETDVLVASFSMSDFLALMNKYPEIGFALTKELSQRLRRTKDSRAFEQESVERRILHVLVDLVGEFGNTIPLTKREIAEMVGTTVESSIRTFSRLEGEGLVSGSRGKITVKNVKALSERLAAA